MLPKVSVQNPTLGWTSPLPGASLHAMPHRGSHPRHQLADPERLVDEIVGAQIERVDLLGFTVAGGQHDDRHIRPLAHRADHLLSIAVRQRQIQHHHVGRIGGDTPGRIGDGSRRRHLVIIRRERGLQETEDRGLVVDHQNAGFGRHDACSGGNVTMMLKPRPFATGLSAVTVPPWASMMPLAIARPRPVPLPPSPSPIAAGARKNLSNTRGRTCAGLPGPSSVTRSLTRPPAISPSRNTWVPAGVWAAALLTMFPRVCSMRAASARTSGRSEGSLVSNVWEAPRWRVAPITRSAISRKSTQSSRSSSAPS